MNENNSNHPTNKSAIAMNISFFTNALDALKGRQDFN